MRIARRLLALVIFLVVLIGAWRFASENSDPVRVYFWLGETKEVELWVVLAMAFLGGALCTGLLASYRLARAGLLARRYRVAVTGLEAELHQLRNLPLAAEDKTLTGVSLRASSGDVGPSA